MVKIEVVGGRYGTGKSRAIVDTIIQERWMSDKAVMVYTNEAAKVIETRLAQEAVMPRVGTVYSLSWPHVRAHTDKGVRARRSRKADWQRRRITSSYDDSLDHYERTAPSRIPVNETTKMARKLHAWDGTGEPPIPLDTPATGQLQYVLPLARWLARGGVLPEDQRYEEVLVDEAQDMSALELAAVCALTREDGVVTCYGDPGQAIFAEAKGIGMVPPAWDRAVNAREMERSWRVGSPAADLAEQVFSYIGQREGQVTPAKHKTAVDIWEPGVQPPARGLVLGHSRASVAAAFRTWGMRDTGITPRAGNPDKELIISTIHAAKGAEADECYLLPWGRNLTKLLRMREPKAVRLAYVALTRARRFVGVPFALKVLL